MGNEGGKRRREGTDSLFDDSNRGDRPSCIADMCLSHEELAGNGFPVIPRSESTSSYTATRTAVADFEFVSTRGTGSDRSVAGRVRVASTPVAPRLLALDCEMCRIGDGRMQLARVTVVDELEQVVMDEVIVPQMPIVDHLTEYSGITPAMVAAATCTQAHATAQLAALLDGNSSAEREEDRAPAVLVGHSLENDMHALQLIHSRIMDTAILHPHPAGLPYRHSLRHLVRQRLDRSIQEGHGTVGHCSAEDALAALHLVELLLPAVQVESTSEPAAAVAAPQPFESFFARPPREAFLPSPDVQLHWQRRDAPLADTTPAPVASSSGVGASAGVGQTLAALYAAATAGGSSGDTAAAIVSSTSSSAVAAAAPRRGRTRSSLFELPALCSSPAFASARLVGDAAFVRHHVGGTADGIAVPAGTHTPRKVLERVAAEVRKYDTAYASDSLSRKHGLVIAAITVPALPAGEATSGGAATVAEWTALDALLAAWLPTLPRGCAVMVATQPNTGAVDAGERDPGTGGVAGGYGTLFLHVTKGQHAAAADDAPVGEVAESS